MIIARPLPPVLSLLTLTLALIGLGGCVTPQSSVHPSLMTTPAAAPAGVYALEFVTLEGRARTLASLRGNPFFLTFWAPWCAQCLAEMESLSRLRASFDQTALPILGVAAQTTSQEILALKRQHGDFPFEVLIDARSQAQRYFKLSGLPVAMVIGPDGEVLPFPDPETGTLSTRIEGPRDWGGYEAVRSFAALLR